MTRYIFVDVEASDKSPFSGVMTELGAVDFTTETTFYSKLWEFKPHAEIPAIPVPLYPISEKESMLNFSAWLYQLKDNVVFVSDNPAYDWQWVNFYFDKFSIKNPFGFSARRIGDFAAGLSKKWTNTSSWKKYRKTKHTHNPVDDAMGNVEAVKRLFEIHKVTW